MLYTTNQKTPTKKPIRTKNIEVKLSLLLYHRKCVEHVRWRQMILLIYVNTEMSSLMRFEISRKTFFGKRS